MLANKKYIPVLFIGIELIAFVGVCLYGRQGIMQIINIKKEHAIIQQENAQLETIIKTYQQDIENLQTYPWYKEQIAREELHMAYPEEKIYVF